MEMDEAFMEKVRGALAVILGEETGDLTRALALLDTLKEEASGPLRHYLAQRSYQKAWVLLAGGRPEKGTCGR